ncbi:MAG: hypothetical protein NVS4B1_26950 [Ktedonobacteraceae bacterium]
MQLQHLDSPVAIVARDLLPSDTAGLDPAFVLGLVTEQGGPTSHISRQSVMLKVRLLPLPLHQQISALYHVLHHA